jgi:hypothetical protein
LPVVEHAVRHREAIDSGIVPLRQASTSDWGSITNAAKKKIAVESIKRVIGQRIERSRA